MTKSILITGGTGSFGRAFIQRILCEYPTKGKVVVLSRDELKQFQMRQDFPVNKFPNLRFFLGDIRDQSRLYRALDGIDVVIHAAALKQVPAAEYNPLEAIKTNILGAANIIEAAIDRNVQKVIALSTDKAANPINLYGATKLCADKLFTAANAYSGAHHTLFSVVRYGNVVGSRGSVIPYFLAQKKTGTITITDERMTRFMITLDQAVDFVRRCLARMQGGEIFVPKIPSARVTDLAQVIAPECRRKIIGIRPGEKLHEAMIGEDDARMTLEYCDHYVIRPSHGNWDPASYQEKHGKPCPCGFRYTSDTNHDWLEAEQIRQLVDEAKSGTKVEAGPPVAGEPTFFSGH